MYDRGSEKFYLYLTGMSKMDNSTLLLESTFQDFLSHKYMDDDNPIHFNMTGPIRYNMTGYPSGKNSLERLSDISKKTHDQLNMQEIVPKV